MRHYPVRYAWIPLVLVNLLLLVIAASGEEGPIGEGSVLHAFLTTDITDPVLELRLRGTLLVGMLLFGLALVLVPFRRGERWAWVALWGYPLFFLLHILAFGTILPDGLLALICVLSLLVPFRTFFPRRQVRQAV